MRRTSGVLLAALAWCAIVLAGTAHAGTPYDALRGADRGDRVKLAPGLTLTVGASSRSGSTLRIRDARVRVAGVATGRRVRVVATPSSVKVLGGRFGVARSLTDREYTVPGSAPITVAWAAGDAEVVGGRLAALPARPTKTTKVLARAADVTEAGVEQALPAAPGGQRWRFGFGLNTSGVVVRVFLGDQQVGSGLVRYDGSYRVSLGLTGYPVLGAKVSVAGDVAGDRLDDPAPVVGLSGRVDGQMQMAQGVSAGDGTLDWDTAGMHIDATAKLACPEGGGLAAGAKGTVQSDSDWDVSVDGQQGPADCRVAENARVDATSVGGRLTSTAGAVTGAITAATPQSDRIVLDRNGTALSGPSLRFTAQGIKLGAGLYIACPAGGGMTATVDATLPYDLAFKTWSAGLGTTTDADGCGVTRELAFEPGTHVDVTVGAKSGRLGIDMDIDARMRTTLVPTKTYFNVALKLSARAGQFDAYVAAETDGAKFSGAVKSDGTFDFQFDINDLQIADAKLTVQGFITRKDPRGKVDIDFKTSASGNIQLDDNFAIRGFSLGIKGNDFAILAVIRMKCSSGYYDLAADGTVQGNGNFTLDIQGLAGDCRVGHLLRLDGHAWDGALNWKDGALDVHIRISIAETNLEPIRDKKFGTMDMDLYGTTALITNRCSDGCGPEKVRIDLDGRARIGIEFFFAGTGIVLDARLQLKIDLDGVIAQRFYLGLTDISIDGRPSTLTVELYGELVRALGKGFVIKPSPTAPPEEQYGDVSGASVTERRTPGSVRAMDVDVRGRRASVELKLSRRSPVTVEIERRRCREGRGCDWRLVTFKVVRPDSKRVARYRPSKRLAAGRYRAVARVGAAGSGRPVTRTFSVR